MEWQRCNIMRNTWPFSKQTRYKCAFVPSAFLSTIAVACASFRRVCLSRCLSFFAFYSSLTFYLPLSLSQCYLLPRVKLIKSLLYQIAIDSCCCLKIDTDGSKTQPNNLPFNPQAPLPLLFSDVTQQNLHGGHIRFHSHQVSIAFF